MVLRKLRNVHVSFKMRWCILCAPDHPTIANNTSKWNEQDWALYSVRPLIGYSGKYFQLYVETICEDPYLFGE